MKLKRRLGAILLALAGVFGVTGAVATVPAGTASALTCSSYKSNSYTLNIKCSSAFMIKYSCRYSSNGYTYTKGWYGHYSWDEWHWFTCGTGPFGERARVVSHTVRT